MDSGTTGGLCPNAAETSLRKDHPFAEIIATTNEIRDKKSTRSAWDKAGETEKGKKAVGRIRWLWLVLRIRLWFTNRGQFLPLQD